MSAKGIFCLEGAWDKDLRKQSSIQPLLTFLYQNAKVPYIYRDCGTLEELHFYLSKFPQSQYKEYPILYLAFHGEPGKILISGKENCTLDAIGDLLQGKCKGQVVLLGSCSVMGINKAHLKKFLKKTGALAVLGYKNEVHWVRSSAFEMLLLSELQENSFNGNGIKALEKKFNSLAKSFMHPNKDKNIEFRMVAKHEI